ncbi:hypothetical protein [Azospirillum sp.]|uniref:hypothetical protein n=1 Tax=Azospirillum sp. TaxID=34012 RepID=UPI002D2C3A93|nr:hypothetical protein [Azospirillum sp.]HYD69073.1 hypothetical protein [Azospirillum sp.]
MSIQCRCLLVREEQKPVWSDKAFRLPPRCGDGVQFEENGTPLTFRITEVLHTPSLEGVDFALLLTEVPGTRGKPFRELFEEGAGTGPTT